MPSEERMFKINSVGMNSIREMRRMNFVCLKEVVDSFVLFLDSGV